MTDDPMRPLRDQAGSAGYTPMCDRKNNLNTPQHNKPRPPAEVVYTTQLVVRFLFRQGPDQFTLATDKLKKKVVKQRLQRKENNSRIFVSASATAFPFSFFWGANVHGESF